MTLHDVLSLLLILCFIALLDAVDALIHARRIRR